MTLHFGSTSVRARWLAALLFTSATSVTLAANQLEVTAEQFKSLGIQTRVVEPASTTPQGVVPGQVMLPPGMQHLATIPFDGVIVGMHVQDGQSVRAGQALLTLRSREGGNAAAEATRLTANAQVANAAAERDHLLVTEGIAANRRAAESRAEADAANAAARAAQSVLHGLKRGTRADEFILLSPAAGVIAERGLHMAEEVKANTVAFVVTQGRERWVEAQLPESLLHLVRVGDSAQLMIKRDNSTPSSDATNNPNGKANNNTTGTIIAVGQQIDASTRSVLLRARFDARTPEQVMHLLPGRSVQLVLASHNTKPAFRVPAAAVVRIATQKDTQDVVFVHNAKGFDIVPVSVSARVEGFAVIQGANQSAAINANTVIAISGVSSLKSLTQNSAD